MYCLFCCEISVGYLYICEAFFVFVVQRSQSSHVKHFLDARTSVVSLCFVFLLFFLPSNHTHKFLVCCVRNTAGIMWCQAGAF